jgi:glycosyltransferase involved in cell wall biosynthesis
MSSNDYRAVRGARGGEARTQVKVAFDSRPSSEMGGIGRYARCLLRALHATGAERAEILETHRPRHADVFHAPWMQGAILRSPCPMVVTLHDLAALKRRSEHLRMACRPHLRHLAVQRATKVIVPTKAVASDAITRLGLEEDRITIIPEAPDPAFHPRSEQQVAQTRARFGLPERYLLWVGSMQRPDPRKPLAKLAATRREMPLVLVGCAGAWTRELPDVTLTGRVPDDDLAAIYTGAHALMLPSADEGFGLPSVEALACGTPVAAFEQPALREVLGEKASFVEPGDLTGLVQAAEAVQRPAARPPSWSWEDAGRATWRVYHRAIARGDEAFVPARRARGRQIAQSQ